MVGEDQFSERGLRLAEHAQFPQQEHHRAEYLLDLLRFFSRTREPLVRMTRCLERTTVLAVLLRNLFRVRRVPIGGEVQVADRLDDLDESLAKRTDPAAAEDSSVRRRDPRRDVLEPGVGPAGEFFEFERKVEQRVERGADCGRDLLLGRAGRQSRRRRGLE